MPDTCIKAKVVIDTINVIDSSVNTTAEPGSSAEWNMTFNVEGETSQWSHDSVRDNTSYPVGAEFVVNLEKGTEVNIRVTGFEHDSTSANDDLPSLNVVAVPAEGWQINTSQTSQTAASDEGSYSIDYTVSCAQFSQALTAAREYIGVFHSGTDRYGLWSAGWPSFEAKWKEWSEQGLRLTRIASYRGEGDRTFIGTYREGSEGYGLWVAEWPSFEAKWKELSEGGLRLVDIAAYSDGGPTVYAGVYRAGTDRYALWVAEWPSFEAKWKELSEGGLRLVAIDTYVHEGRRFFAGVYREGNDGYALWVGNDWPGFRAKCDEFAGQGLGLLDVASYREGDVQRFAGVFRSGVDGQGIFREDWDGLVAKWEALAKLNRRLTSLDTFVEGSEE